MPWKTVALAKKAGAITHYHKKPIAIQAINKLYEIYDAIKNNKTIENPMAVAISTWKGLVVLKKGTWVLKPKKAKKEQREGEGKTEAWFPIGVSYIGGASLEDFREALRTALQAVFEGEKTYLTLVATYRTKVYINKETNGVSEYYEVPYTVKNGQFEFGTPVKMVKRIKFQKADQKNWDEYRGQVRAFVEGKNDLGSVVKAAIKTKRQPLYVG